MASFEGAQERGQRLGKLSVSAAVFTERARATPVCAPRAAQLIQASMQPSPTPLLVDPYIVHPHRLREDRCCIRTARPGTTHRNVENDEKRMVVHPASRKTLRGDGQVEGAVDVPANRIRLPLDGVHVRSVGEGARGQVICAANALRTGVPGAVHRAVYPAGLLADVLHDVDLAAPGPAGGGDIIAQHPESGPQPLPTRYLNTGLDATVLPRAQPLGLKPGRGVFAGGERLAAGLDDEVARIDVRVRDAVGVELELAVPPAVAPGLAHPFRGVERWAVELIVPHELPHGGPSRGSGERGTRGDRDPEQDAGHVYDFR